MATLVDWWLFLATREAEMAQEKATEYGSTDLREVGRTMAMASGLGAPEGRGTDEWYSELGCYFYAVGKMARWTDAVLSGRQVSNDTIADLKVYMTMVQRIRECGGWPAAPGGTRG